MHGQGKKIHKKGFRRKNPTEAFRANVSVVDEERLSFVEVDIVENEKHNVQNKRTNGRGIKTRSGDRADSYRIDEACNPAGSIANIEQLRTVRLELCKAESGIDLKSAEGDNDQTVDNINSFKTAENRINHFCSDLSV